jgi:predicted O-methyltransferase YrrM
VTATPPLVRRALELAERLQFERSSIPEVGRLLHVLAGQRGRNRAAEIGAGCGYGAAWIVSALDPAVPFFTVELDPRRAEAVTELFVADANVHVLQGDWHELMPAEAPFDLLFYDGGGKQHPARSACPRQRTSGGGLGEPGGSPDCASSGSAIRSSRRSSC